MGNESLTSTSSQPGPAVDPAAVSSGYASPISRSTALVSVVAEAPVCSTPATPPACYSPAAPAAPVSRAPVSASYAPRLFSRASTVCRSLSGGHRYDLDRSVDSSTREGLAIAAEQVLHGDSEAQRAAGLASIVWATQHPERIQYRLDASFNPADPENRPLILAQLLSQNPDPEVRGAQHQAAALAIDHPTSQTPAGERYFPTTSKQIVSAAAHTAMVVAVQSGTQGRETVRQISTDCTYPNSVRYSAATILAQNNSAPSSVQSNTQAGAAAAHPAAETIGRAKPTAPQPSGDSHPTLVHIHSINPGWAGWDSHASTTPHSAGSGTGSVGSDGLAFSPDPETRVLTELAPYLAHSYDAASDFAHGTYLAPQSIGLGATVSQPTPRGISPTHPAAIGTQPAGSIGLTNIRPDLANPPVPASGAGPMATPVFQQRTTGKPPRTALPAGQRVSLGENPAVPTSVMPVNHDPVAHDEPHVFAKAVQPTEERLTDSATDLVRREQPNGVSGSPEETSRRDVAATDFTSSPRTQITVNPDGSLGTSDTPNPFAFSIPAAALTREKETFATGPTRFAVNADQADNRRVQLADGSTGSSDHNSDEGGHHGSGSGHGNQGSEHDGSEGFYDDAEYFEYPEEEFHA